MKLATYRLPDGEVRHGEVTGDRVTDLGPGDLGAVIGALGAIPSGTGAAHPSTR